MSFCHSLAHLHHLPRFSGLGPKSLEVTVLRVTLSLFASSVAQWIGNQRGARATWGTMALRRAVTPLGPSCGPHELLELGESY